MTNTATRTRKAASKTPAKRTAKKTTAPAHVRKQAKEVSEMVPAGPAMNDKPKKAQTFEERDWTYLDEKDPSEQHVILAKEINRRTNLEEPISPKHVQAVLAMFPHFQKSQTNKSRSGYVPLAEAIVEKRSEHMKLAHQEAREIMDGLQIEVAKKAAPAAKKAPAKAPAKKATATARKTTTATAKKAPARKARVTKPAPAAEAF
jgi:hypothetical protein